MSGRPGSWFDWSNGMRHPFRSATRRSACALGVAAFLTQGTSFFFGSGAAAVADAPTSVPAACALAFASQEQPFSGDAGGRLKRVDVDGRRVVVLEPRDFESSRTYPVVYLFHGGVGIPEAWLSETSLVDFTHGLPDDQQAIVVLPDAKLNSAWADWHDGSYHDETLFMNEIAPFI